MNQKNNSNIEISLNKSPSGIWKVSKSPKLHFEAWQRLWIVIGVVYLFIVAGSYHILMPDRELIERNMVFSITDEVRRYDGMAFAGESPRTIFEIARSQGYDAWIKEVRLKYRIGPDGNSGFDKIEKNYQAAISDLPVKQTVGVLISVIVWSIPMVILYFIGFIIDWIKRGTRGIRV